MSSLNYLCPVCNQRIEIEIPTGVLKAHFAIDRPCELSYRTPLRVMSPQYKLYEAALDYFVYMSIVSGIIELSVDYERNLATYRLQGVADSGFMVGLDYIARLFEDSDKAALELLKGQTAPLLEKGQTIATEGK